MANALKVYQLHGKTELSQAIEENLSIAKDWQKANMSDKFKMENKGYIDGLEYALILINKTVFTK